MSAPLAMSKDAISVRPKLDASARGAKPNYTSTHREHSGWNCDKNLLFLLSL